MGNNETVKEEFIKAIATAKSSMKSLKWNFVTNSSFSMFKTYLCIILCQKTEIGKKLLFITFVHYLSLVHVWVYIALLDNSWKGMNDLTDKTLEEELY